MISLRDLSIPKKIVALSMIITAAALLVASGALITYDLIQARQTLRVSTEVFARIVADNTTAAVSFNDQAAAVDTLNSVRAEPSVVSACVYTPQGLFAAYAAADNPPCPNHVPSNLDERGHVWVTAPINLDNKKLGIVALRATLAPAYAHLRLEILTIAGILLLAGLFAYALSSRLHRLVSEPILSLARTANAVSREENYSIRAEKQSEDELGTLVDSFNDMLARIQVRETVLEQQSAELVQANRMKDEFLATLSHELRTPLNSILGWSVLIQSGRLAEDKERRALEAIEGNARVQARLIEDLLDVSRIISGKFTLDSSEVALRQIIATAIEIVRPAAEAKQIQIEFETESPNPHVLGDGPRLQQAVWNLLSNAVKFTGEQGTVHVCLSVNHSVARISVVDDGIGIEPEFLPFVFERFRQADGSSTRAYGGLGLGLAIVRHIVETHGGSVHVASEGKGKGASFTIELPVADSTFIRGLSRPEQDR